jgi:phosphoribosylanthranilate isomerase
MTLIKICGLSTPDTLDVALTAGADMVGLVFHPKSPRYVAPDHAAMLAERARGRARIVALVVDPDDALIDSLTGTVAPDLFQFHGQEPPERVAAIRARSGIGVMKAIGVATREDLPAIASYRPVADHLLIDAKPPRDAAYPGGHGRPFDWAILDAVPPGTPFFLSGGLTPGTVADAIRQVRPAGVDVSSGVETAPGVKSPDLIRAFIAAARAACQEERDPDGRRPSQA